MSTDGNEPDSFGAQPYENVSPNELTTLSGSVLKIDRPTARPRGAFSRFIRSPVGVLAATYLVIMMVACFCAALLAPYSPIENNLSDYLQGPSALHWLGTDQLGRDVLSRLLYGGQSVFSGVAEAAAIALIVGVPIGVLAGYHGGKLDAVVSRAVDVWMSLPGIVVLLLVLAVFGSSQTLAMATLGILFAPGILRVSRGATIATRHELYVSAARVFGLTNRQIMTRHIMPRIVGPVVINTSIMMANILLVQSGLAFLGLTVQPPNPSWGGMVTDASSVLQQQPWLIVPSGAAIALTAIAFIVVGDSIRDATRDARSPTDNRMRRNRRVDQELAPTELDSDDTSIATDCDLRVQNLSVELPLPNGWTAVVDKVSFEVRAGETIGLVGESGCGKSLTALAVLGLIPGGGVVSNGSITLSDEELVGLSARNYRHIRGKEIAYISQEPMSSLDPSFTVGNQLRESIRTHEHLGAAECRTRAIELLAMVGLPKPERVAKRFPHQLSGGMAQRVVIARALAGRPRLLVADEPTTALDSTVQREILNLLLSIQRESGMAIILVTHDWGVVAQTCDRAVVMYAGQVVEQASVEQIFASPLHPYTAALIEADPHRAGKHERLNSIEGTVPEPQEWPKGCRFAERCSLREDKCEQSPIALRHVADDRVSRCIRIDELVASRRSVS
jgi:peptide/nickel transport system permease protein